MQNLTLAIAIAIILTLSVALALTLALTRPLTINLIQEQPRLCIINEPAVSHWEREKKAIYSLCNIQCFNC